MFIWWMELGPRGPKVIGRRGPATVERGPRNAGSMIRAAFTTTPIAGLNTRVVWEKELLPSE